MTWSQEEKLNAMRYGLCPFCKTPRIASTDVTIDADGVETVTHGIVCPKGCGQEPPS